MLAAHARIQAEDALNIDTHSWWESIKYTVFLDIDELSRDGKCELIINEDSNLNLEDWINNHFYVGTFQMEMKRLGYTIETTEFHDIVFEIKVKW